MQVTQAHTAIKTQPITNSNIYNLLRVGKTEK